LVVTFWNIHNIERAPRNTIMDEAGHLEGTINLFEYIQDMHARVA
jgi:hypothetical protein